MGFDLLTKKRHGRDWSISIDGEKTAVAGPLENLDSPWLYLGVGSLLIGGYGIQRNKRPAMYGGISLAALSAYKLVRKD